MRDNIHCDDVVRAFEAFHRAPRAAAVYNLGGGRESNCSMREAIAACERISGKHARLDVLRPGPDGRPPLVDLATCRRSRRDYPEWELEYDLETTLRAIHDFNVERWAQLTSRRRPVSTS